MLLLMQLALLLSPAVIHGQNNCQDFVFICVKEKANINEEKHVYGMNGDGGCLEVPFSEAVISNISNCTVIDFQTDSVALDFNFHIGNLHKLSFTSSALNGTNITCTTTNKELGKRGGLTFTNIDDLELNRINVIGCGGQHTLIQHNQEIAFRSAVFITHSMNVFVSNVNICKSNGKGLSLIECGRKVRLIGCDFVENKEQNKTMEGGGGLLIVNHGGFHESTGWQGDRQQVNDYLIDNCTFTNNEVYSASYLSSLQFDVSKGGGAVAVFISDESTNYYLTINRVNGSSNKAVNGYGGAVSIILSGNTSNNTITICNSTFQYNEALEYGGGGLNVGFLYDRRHDSPRLNKMIFYDICIYNNSGGHGGGGSFFSSVTPNGPLENSFEFFSCEWIGNCASFGSAVMVSPQAFGASTSVYQPSISFTDCTFSNNVVKNVANFMEFSNHNHLHQYTEGRGAVYIRSFTVQLHGRGMFSSNTGSAVYCFESVIRVVDNSHIEFIDNRRCLFGGAIQLIGSSSIQLGQNTILDFTNNTALDYGGAIYAYSTDMASSRMLGLCFIQYIIWRSPSDDRINSTLRFRGNRLTNNMKNNTGTSIFVSSLSPCVRLCPNNSTNTHQVVDSLQCIANITFDENVSQAVGTEGDYFMKSDNFIDNIFLVPGKTWTLPFIMKNELNETVAAPLLYAMVESGNVSLRDKSYSTGYCLIVYGKPQSKGTIKISTIFYHNVSVTIDVTLSGCPPGFVYNPQHEKCSCSVSSKSSTYNGIFDCNELTFTASQYIGYWSGYIDETTNSIAEYGNENILFTGTCPLGFCFSSKDAKINLPDTPIGLKLSQKVCSENREGILCGKCIKGHSVYFHSPMYKCGPNTNCHLGLLLYLLSEILPLTILFCITVLFHIDFNSGYLNGFILFAQIFDTLSLLANGGVLEDSKTQKVMLSIIKMMYSPFNLEFFQIDSLEFCLFKGANFLQIVTIRYVSLIYSLLLIIALIFLMRCNYCYKVKIVCLRLCITNSSSMVDSLAAFLVLCYSQCCRNCYQILNRSWLEGKGLRYSKYTRVFRMGSMKYSDSEFIFYAVISSVFLVFFIIIPPVLLILQPLAHKFLPNRFFENSKVQTACLHVERFKPLFDKLQGCFKDKHRYFAGLYLVYRFIPNAIFAFLNVRLHVFVLVQICLVLMLAIHCWTKPYRNNIHNNIDTAIFGNMLIINTITIYRYFMTQTFYFPPAFPISGYFQLLLVYLPAIVFIISLIGVLMWRMAPTSFRVWVSTKNTTRQRLATFTFLRGLDDTNSLSSNDSIDRPFEKSFDSMKLQAPYTNMSDTSSSEDTIQI